MLTSDEVAVFLHRENLQPNDFELIDVLIDHMKSVLANYCGRDNWDQIDPDEPESFDGLKLPLLHLVLRHFRDIRAGKFGSSVKSESFQDVSVTYDIDSFLSPMDRRILQSYTVYTIV